MFVLEIILKLVGLGCMEFFCGDLAGLQRFQTSASGPEWYWNLFDFFVVSISVADVVLDYVAQKPGIHYIHLRAWP